MKTTPQAVAAMLEAAPHIDGKRAGSSDWIDLVGPYSNTVIGRAARSDEHTVDDAVQLLSARSSSSAKCRFTRQLRY